MMYARHHVDSQRSDDLAASLLNEAWDTLASLPSSESVHYERVFNRNGMALILYRRGEYGDAARLLEEGTSFVEKSRYGRSVHLSVLQNNLGRVYGQLGQRDLAERNLLAATEIDPLFAEYWQDLANEYVVAGRMGEARKCVEKAIELDPAIPECHALLGYLLAGRDDKRFVGAREGESWDSRFSASLPMLTQPAQINGPRRSDGRPPERRPDL